MDMGRRQQLLDSLFLSFQDVDWSRTRAYARGNFGQIFINRQGREPEGIVSEGDYKRVVDEIIARLPTLRDPKTGAPLVSQAKRRDELFHGPAIDRAPDIAVFMADERNVALGTADFPANTVAEKAIGNTGDHRFPGILMMQGRGIKRGSLPQASLLDVAPTVLHLLGLPVPKDMDGRVLLEALGDDLQGVAYTEGQAASTAAQSGYTAAEEAEILAHLDSLGYLG
jgi:predicted AlkP superfamily phosphohydrolase/phosphomutase